MSPRRAAVLALSAGICFGAVEWAGVQLHRDYSPWQVVWLRYAMHLLIVAAVAAARGVNPLPTGRLGLQLLRSMLMLVMPASFLAGLRHAGAGSVWTVFWTVLLVCSWPAAEWRAVGARRLLMLHLGAWAGIALILRPQIGFAGAVPGLAMGASFAAYLALTHTLRAESAFSRLFYTALGVFAVLTPFVVPWYLPPSTHDWLVLFFIAVSGLACLYLLDLALDAMPAVRVYPYLLIAAAAAAVLHVRDSGRLGAATLCGVVLLAACLWWAVLREPAGAQHTQA